jgi:hypothetical protein
VIDVLARLKVEGCVAAPAPDLGDAPPIGADVDRDGDVQRERSTVVGRVVRDPTYRDVRRARELGGEMPEARRDLELMLSVLPHIGQHMGLTPAALTPEPSLIMQDDPRRQPLQPPRLIFGNVAADSIAPGAPTSSQQARSRGDAAGPMGVRNRWAVV